MRAATPDDEILDSIDRVPWTYLAHAYHKQPDARRYLGQFASAGTSVNTDAFEWLDNSVLHQGNIYSASAPILWILTDILALRPDHPGAEAILAGLQALAESYVYELKCSGHEEEAQPVRKSLPGEPYWETWIDEPLNYAWPARSQASPEYFKATRVTSRALREVLLHARPVIHQCLKSPARPELFRAALGAWFYSVQVEPIPVADVHEFRTIVGNSAFLPEDWVSSVMMFGELQEDIGSLVSHPDWRVRLGASLSPATMGIAESVHELASALENEDQLKREFPRGLAHVQWHIYFHVFWALLERTSPATIPGEALDAICDFIQRHPMPSFPELGFGRALEWAFPNRHAPRLPLRREEFVPLPDQLTNVQRALLEAVCGTDEIWDSKIANTSLAFTRVQLPHDREVIRTLLKG